MSGEFDGNKLRELRIAKGIRQNALAQMAKISRSYLCDLEKGRTSAPALATLLRLAEALGVRDINVLLRQK